MSYRPKQAYGLSVGLKNETSSLHEKSIKVTLQRALQAAMVRICNLPENFRNDVQKGNQNKGDQEQEVIGQEWEWGKPKALEMTLCCLPTAGSGYSRWREDADQCTRRGARRPGRSEGGRRNPL